MVSKKKKAVKAAKKKTAKKAAPAVKKKKGGVPDFVKGQFCITLKGKKALVIEKSLPLFMDIKLAAENLVRYPSKSHAKAALEEFQEGDSLGTGTPIKDISSAEVEPVSTYFANTYEASLMNSDGVARIIHSLVHLGDEPVTLRETVKDATAQLNSAISDVKQEIKLSDAHHKEALKTLAADKKTSDVELAKKLSNAQKELASFQKQMTKLS